MLFKFFSAWTEAVEHQPWIKVAIKLALEKNVKLPVELVEFSRRRTMQEQLDLWESGDEDEEEGLREDEDGLSREVEDWYNPDWNAMVCAT